MTVEYNNKARYGYILVGGEVYYAYEQLNEDYSELRRQHEEESDDPDHETIQEASEEQVRTNRERRLAILEEERRRIADNVADNILERFNNNNEQYPW